MLAAKPAISSVISPLSQAKVNGPTPPVTVKSIEPFEAPQVASTCVADKVAVAALVMVADALAIQPLKSVKITL